MRKSLWIISVLFAAIVVPYANADPVDLCTFTTTAGEPFVLGTPGKSLTDSATLGRLCSFPGTLTFTVMGQDIFVPQTFQFDGKDSVTAMGTFPITGPVPDVAGEYKWFATYTPKGGKPIKSDFETQVVKKKLATPEPGTLALMLLGVGVLLVTPKRIGQGRPPKRIAH
jgi:hypothetical protein